MITITAKAFFDGIIIRSKEIPVILYYNEEDLNYHLSQYSDISSEEDLKRFITDFFVYTDTTSVGIITTSFQKFFGPEASYDENYLEIDLINELVDKYSYLITFKEVSESIGSYTLISVHNYRGGELDTQINLSYDELKYYFLEDIRDIINEQEFEFERTNVDVWLFLHSTDIINRLKSPPYAGGDRSVFEIYECKDDKLIEVDFVSFITGIIEQYCNDLLK